MALASWTGRVPDAVTSWRERAETEVYALYLAYRDPRTPAHARALVLLIVAYAASPIDPIPDFVPVVGYLDELVVLPIGVALALRVVPGEVMEDCRDRAEAEIDAGRTRWIAAGLILLAWAVLAALAVRLLTPWL